MNKRPVIPIQAEHAVAGHGNALPLLHEIRHALARLLERGQETVIDLRSLPMAPGDEQQLEQALGTGEVRVELDAMGPSTIRETAFPGVWLVTHSNPDGDIISRFVEVTRVPAILSSQDRDIRAGLDRLGARLSASGNESQG